jgi:acetyltransferase-like isoleucine patch superfamily enzyme
MRRTRIQFVRLCASVFWARWVHAPFWTAAARLSLWMWGASVGRGLSVRGPLRLYVSGRLSLGRGVTINSGPSNCVGGDRRMSIRVGKGAELIIGNGCGLSNSTIFATVRIVIHDETFIGGGCDIYDSDFHPLAPEDRQAGRPAASAGVEIGPRAFLGSHSIILKGVTIGEGAVIAAGSVITRDVPAFEVWGGRPARFLRKVDVREGEEGAWRMEGGAASSIAKAPSSKEPGGARA